MTPRPLIYTGKPCPHGHGPTRYTSNRKCVACAKEEQARLYDKATATARKRAYRARLKESANV